MALLKILTYPNMKLLNKAEEVAFPLTAEQQTFIQDLTETMYGADGAGLGANQVGRREAIFVVGAKAREGGANEPIVCVNPKILDRSTEKVRAEEACLSLPGVSAKVERHKSVTVRAQDVYGNWFDCEGDSEDYMSRALQHEMDHLDGRLFVHHLGVTYRQMVLKKYAKIRQRAADYEKRVARMKAIMDAQMLKEKSETRTGTEVSSNAPEIVR